MIFVAYIPVISSLVFFQPEKNAKHLIQQKGSKVAPILTFFIHEDPRNPTRGM